MSRVYAVLDQDGNVEGLESDLDGAIERAEDTSATGSVFVEPGAGQDEIRENPIPTVQDAYRMTGLPAILKAKYGVDHLTGQMVHDVDLDDAYAALKAFFPQGDNWQTPSKAVSSFFSVNAKLAKGFKKAARAGHLDDLTISMGLALAPHQIGYRKLRDVDPNPQKLWKNPPQRLLQIADGDPEILAALTQKGATLCARSTASCRASCLVFSGQNETVDEPYAFKMAMTAALFHDPLAFARLLLEASRRHFYLWSVKGSKTKFAPGQKVFARKRDGDVPPGAFIRLNVYSDIPWELFFPDLVFGDWAFMPPMERGKKPSQPLEIVSEGSWYDYSAVAGRLHQGTNYDVTMSFKGSESNVRDCIRAAKAGQRIAPVFVARSVKKGHKGGWAPSGGKQLRDKYKNSDTYPWEFMGMPVWNADRTDIRPDDPEGYVAGLTFKVPRKKVERGTMEVMIGLDALVDKFVIEVMEVEGHLIATGTPAQEDAMDYEADAEVNREVAAL